MSVDLDVMAEKFLEDLTHFSGRETTGDKARLFARQVAEALCDEFDKRAREEIEAHENEDDDGSEESLSYMNGVCTAINIADDIKRELCGDSPAGETRQKSE